MSRSYSGPRVVDPEAVLETIDSLTAAGETDAAGGGVATAALASELGIERHTAADHVRDLCEAGRLERVDGLGPSGPRPSYRPTDGGGR